MPTFGYFEKFFKEVFRRLLDRVDADNILGKICHLSGVLCRNIILISFLYNLKSWRTTNLYSGNDWRI